MRKLTKVCFLINPTATYGSLRCKSQPRHAFIVINPTRSLSHLGLCKIAPSLCDESHSGLPSSQASKTPNPILCYLKNDVFRRRRTAWRLWRRSLLVALNIHTLIRSSLTSLRRVAAVAWAVRGCHVQSSVMLINCLGGISRYRCHQELS